MKLEYTSITLKQHETKPYLINVIAEVNDNGYYYNDIIGQYCYYDKEGRITLQDGTRKKYKRFSAMLTFIYNNLDSSASINTNLVEVVKAEAEQMRVLSTVTNEVVETTTVNNVTNDSIIVETPVTTELVQSYTAFNRSFPSFIEAYTYCIQSDFDPSYITTEEPTMASQSLPTIEHPELFQLYNNTFSTYSEAYNHAINKDIPLSIILSSNATITNNELQSYEKEYSTNKNNISHDNANKWLNHLISIPSNSDSQDRINHLTRIIERYETRIQSSKYHEEELTKTIQKFEALQDKLYLLGMSKKESHTMSQYYYKGESIHTWFSGVHVNKLYSDLLDIYDTYFLNASESIVNDPSNLIWYELLYRPLSPYCQPKNHIQYDDTKGRHGIIAYNRHLTDSELSEYELRLFNVS